MQEREIERWITVNGKHIPIRKGQTVDEALKEKQIAIMAQYAGIKLLMNSMLEEGLAQAASLQIGVTLPNLVDFGSAYFSPLRLDDDITTYSEQVRNGWVHINDRPGLGVEIREDVVQKYLQDEFWAEA